MRMTTNIFLFLVLANAATGFFAAAGVWQDMGVQYDTDLGEKYDNVQQDIDEIRKQQGFGNIGGTLISTISNTVGLLGSMGAVVLFGVGKLVGAFVPPQFDFIIVPLNLVLPTIVAIDIASFVSGREA